MILLPCGLKTGSRRFPHKRCGKNSVRRARPCAAAKAPAPRPGFAGGCQKKTSAAKLRARIVEQSQAPRRRAERSESAAERARKAPSPGVHPVVPLFAHRFCAPPGAPFLKGRHKFALWNDTIALRLKKTGRARIGWRSKKRLCYALFCPSAFFVKHSANFLKNAKGHHKFICANDNITLPGRKSRSCTAYSF